MKLSDFEREVLQFLFDNSVDSIGLDAVALKVASRLDTCYAKIINFVHDQDVSDIEALSLLGGVYYLVHPENGDIIDVTVDLVNGIPFSVEFVPYFADPLPEDISEYKMQKID